MKSIIALVLFFTALTACNDKGGGKKWTESQRSNFVKNCMSTAIDQFQNDSAIANTYCTCMLEKVEAKYKSEEVANEKMTIKDANEMANGCIP